MLLVQKEGETYDTYQSTYIAVVQGVHAIAMFIFDFIHVVALPIEYLIKES